jgi:hypothetical protein
MAMGGGSGGDAHASASTPDSYATNGFVAAHQLNSHRLVNKTG